MKFPIPDAALARHIAVVGETGSGKTHDTKKVVEHVVAEGYRVCVLDPIKSDWWGITSSASGKRPGLPFKILGGPHGHVPLHATSGNAIGQLVGEGKLPLSIIDMADFEPGGQQKFFEHFAQSLWRHIKGIVYLVIEEAHEIAPKERAGFGAENMAIHWAKKIATGSRTKGIRLIIASQRTQAVHNALLGSCGTLMAHSLSLPADQKPIIDWLNANVRDKTLRKTIEADLAFVPTGTAWVCCAKDNFFEKVKFGKIETFDNSATPDNNSTDEAEVTVAPVDAAELRAIIGDAVKEAEANDPKLLKAEIARLKSEMQKQSVVETDDNRHELAAGAAYGDGFSKGEKQGYEQGFAAGHEEGFKEGARAMRDVYFAKLEVARRALPESLEGLPAYLPNPPMIDHRAPPAPVAQRTEHRTSTPSAAGSIPAGGANGEMKPKSREILDAIHRAHPVSLTFAAAAARAGASKRSSAYDTYEKQVRGSGEVKEIEGGRLRSLRPTKPTAHAADPVDTWAGKLPPSYGRMLRAIVHSRGLSALEVADHADVSPTSSGLSAGLAELRSLALIEERGGLYYAAEGLR